MTNLRTEKHSFLTVINESAVQTYSLNVFVQKKCRVGVVGTTFILFYSAAFVDARFCKKKFLVYHAPSKRVIRFQITW